MNKWIKLCQEKIEKRGIKNYEIYAINVKRTIIDVKDKEVELLNVAENRGISLRIICEGRLGFAYITEITESTIDYLIKQAISSAQVTTPDPFLNFPNFIGNYPIVSVYDKEIENLSLSKKIDFALTMEMAAKDYAPCIKKVRHSQFQEMAAQIFIANHHGLNFSYKRTLFSGSVLVMAEEKGEAEMGWHYAFNPFFNNLNPEIIGKKAAQLAADALGGKPIATQKINAIFTNRVMSEILQILSSSFLADEVQKGKSLLAPHLGKKIMSNLVNIYDNGLYPNGYATRPCDDEGIPQQKTILVENGTIKGFLYDSYTAAKEDKKSTGNAGRMSLEAPPKVEITNLYLKPHDLSFERLLKTLDKGLVITDVLGMHTADPISGDFSVGAAGYWIEGGNRLFPVKSIAIAGNIVDLFKKIVAIGNDLEFFGNCGSPSVLIEGVQVSGN